MAMRTTFLVQTFVIKRKRLVPGDREVSPTESGALKKAEAMAGRMPGTAAIKVVADDETGRAGERDDPRTVRRGAGGFRRELARRLGVRRFGPVPI